MKSYHNSFGTAKGKSLAEVREVYPDARQETDGSIVFECPTCRAEGHHSKQAKLYANGALSCVRFASAGSDANREHCRPVREALGLTDSPRAAFITKELFDGALTIECKQAERGKVLLVARNCTSTLNRDVISLDLAKERNAFSKALPGFDDKQRKEIDQALNQLADEYDRVCEAVEDEDEGETTEHVIFKELPDGRLIEQLHGGKFAVYDGSVVE